MRHLYVCAFAIIAACTSSGDTQKLAIGSPCKASADCGTGKFFCATDHPNGYCKKDCKVDADCPMGSVCAHDGSVGECHKSCNTVVDCRKSEGYICKPADTTTPSGAGRSATTAACSRSSAWRASRLV